MAPISSQTYISSRPTTVATTVRQQSVTPHPGLPPVNALGAEGRRADSIDQHPTGVNVVQVEAKVGSKDNVNWEKPGGDVKIFDEKLNFKLKAQSRVGSMDNINWTPPVGQVQIVNEPVRFRETARAKVGSFVNLHLKPLPAPGLPRSTTDVMGRSKSVDHTAESIYRHSARLTSAAGFFRAPQVSSYVEVPAALPGNRKIAAKVGSLENIHHRPGGGHKRIVDEKIPVAKLGRVSSKVGSFENIAHVPGGGQVQIVDVPVRPRARSKVGSLGNIRHKPLGGHVAVVNEPTVYVTKQELAEAAS